MAEGHEFLEYLYLSCKGPAASERALAAGKAGEDIPFPVKFFPYPQPSRQSRRGPQQVTGKLKYEAKSPLQMRQLKIDHFSGEPPASYQQVKI